MFEEDVALITCASCEGKKMLLVVSASGNLFLLPPTSNRSIRDQINHHILLRNTTTKIYTEQEKAATCERCLESTLTNATQHTQTVQFQTGIKEKNEISIKMEITYLKFRCDLTLCLSCICCLYHGPCTQVFYFSLLCVFVHIVFIVLDT